jgi:hypothetical protein
MAAAGQLHQQQVHRLRFIEGAAQHPRHRLGQARMAVGIVEEDYWQALGYWQPFANQNAVQGRQLCVWQLGDHHRAAQPADIAGAGYARTGGGHKAQRDPGRVQFLHETPIESCHGR